METNAAKQLKCPYCGGVSHDGMCPKVRAIEYHPNGAIKRVEFNRQTLDSSVTRGVRTLG